MVVVALACDHDSWRSVTVEADGGMAPSTADVLPKHSGVFHGTRNLQVGITTMTSSAEVTMAPTRHCGGGGA
jgi:hypothetical protein